MPTKHRYILSILAASLIALVLIFLGGDTSRAQDEVLTATPRRLAAVPVRSRSRRTATATLKSTSWRRTAATRAT